ncbi:hypothetical protein ATC82_01630, partial [Staphylococcus aureus]
WLKHVFEQDIANLSIHLRTRKEISKVDAQWELIEAIKNLRDEIAGWDINQCSMLYKVILAVVD